MTLLYDTYRREPDGALLCEASGQRVAVRPAAHGGLTCDYRDAEMSRRVEVRRFETGHPNARFLFLDWDRNDPTIRARYGAWRRLTWFLLDALAVWHVEARSPDQSVLAIGGWLDGQWRPDAGFECQWSSEGSAYDRPLEPVPPWPPFPLDAAAPRWRFEPGLEGAREGRIKVAGDGPDGSPVADPAVSVADQLVEVPRFIADDGTLLFFHRVRPHAGPEYAPALDYGLASGEIAFYFSERGASLVDRPIRLCVPARPDPPALREELPPATRHLLAAGGGPLPDRWRLSPALRERLYFALAEAGALMQGRPWESLPRMRSLEHHQEMRVGAGLGGMMGAPFSTGLPLTVLRSTPDLVPQRRQTDWRDGRGKSALELYLDARDGG